MRRKYPHNRRGPDIDVVVTGDYDLGGHDNDHRSDDDDHRSDDDDGVDDQRARRAVSATTDHRGPDDSGPDDSGPNDCPARTVAIAAVGGQPLHRQRNDD